MSKGDIRPLYCWARQLSATFKPRVMSCISLYIPVALVCNCVRVYACWHVLHAHTAHATVSTPQHCISGLCSTIRSFYDIWFTRAVRGPAGTLFTSWNNLHLLGKKKKKKLRVMELALGLLVCSSAAADLSLFWWNLRGWCIWSACIIHARNMFASALFSIASHLSCRTYVLWTYLDTVWIPSVRPQITRSGKVPHGLCARTKWSLISRITCPPPL